MTVSELVHDGRWICCECSRPTSGVTTIEFDNDDGVAYFHIAACMRHGLRACPLTMTAMAFVVQALRETPEGAWMEGCRTFLVSAAGPSLIAYPAQMTIAPETVQ